MNNRLFVIAVSGLLCAGCATKIHFNTTPCHGNTNDFEQVKLTVTYDATGGVTDIELDRPEVTIYRPPNPKFPEQKGQVCWTLVPNEDNKGKGHIAALKQSLILGSKDGTTPFEWKAKKKYPGDVLEISSGVPLAASTKDGWNYQIVSDKFVVDPKIIIIDVSH
jgi:hypothetical protein